MPWSRLEKVGWLVFAAVLVSTFAWTAAPFYVPNNDGSRYLICAKSLDAGTGYSYLGEPFHLRPPGQSFLLIPVVAGAGYNFLRIQMWISAIAAVGIFGFALWLRPRLGTGVSMLLAGSLWLHPELQALIQRCQADIPSFTLLAGCLLLDDWTRRRPHCVAAAIGFGLVLGAGVWVRFLSVLLVPSLLLSRWLLLDRGMRRRLAAMRLPALTALVAILVAAPWQIRNAGLEVTVPAEQTNAHSYLTRLLREDAGDPSSQLVRAEEIFARVAGNVPRATVHLGEWFMPGAGSRMHLVLGIAMLGVALFSAIRGRGIEGIFVLTTFAALCMYPVIMHRYFLLVYVVCLSLSVFLLRDLIQRFAASKKAAGLCMAVVLAYALVVVDPRSDRDTRQAQHDEWVRLAERIHASLGRQPRWAAWEGSTLHVYLDEPVYSMNRVATRAGGDPEVALQLAGRHGVHHFILETRSASPFEAQLTEFVRERAVQSWDLGSHMVFELSGRPNHSDIPR